MPPKPNGFYMFMSQKQKEIKRNTNRAPTMREMPGLCKDAWKALPAAEKAHYDNMAKQERSKLQNSGDQAWAKLDSQRQVIADRKDPVKEENKRRTLERKILLNSWEGQDIKDLVFHILDFQVMYDDFMEDQHFPLEIGMVSMSLNSGIINFMHRFLNPGEVPQGNRHTAIQHAENSHKIPLQFEHADGNFKALTNHMTDFVQSDSQGDEMPVIFCLQAHRRLVENCLDFIYNKVYVADANRFQKVFCLEDLVHCMISFAEGKQVPESQITDMLRQNRWDYNSSIRCSFHEDLDCAFCSLSIVRRYSFAIFDTLSTLLGFKLTEKHMPDEMKQMYIPESFGFGRQSAQGATSDGPGDDRYNRSRKSSYNSSYSDSYSNQSYSQRGRGNLWQSQRQPENTFQPPIVDPVKVPLSDEESEEEEEEVKPKPTAYTLGNMRLPKSLAQVQTHVGDLSIQDDNETTTPPTMAAASSSATTTAPAGAWGGVARGAAFIPMGRGAAPPRMAGIRPMGRAAPSPVMPPPPPGFERPPMMAGASAYSMINDQDFPALGGLGRGTGKGRGLPSQR